jgi:hypothetical protein
MVAAIISSLNYASKEVAIYLNFFNLIIGIPGGCFILIVFLSLKTFRENTCAFYLIIMSIFNIGQLIIGSLSRIFNSGFGIDWTVTSLAFCKFRVYFLQTCSLISLTCLCLATIDQYFSTCSHPRLQHWSNIKLVRALAAITVIFWSIFAILYPIYYDIIISPTTGQLTCMNTNSVFDRYQTDFHRIVMIGFLPNIITAVFAILAYRNIHNLAYRMVPLIRRELDKQLTRMLLLQVIFNIFFLLFFNIVSIIVPYFITTTDPVVTAKLQFVQILSYCFYYMYAAVSIQTLNEYLFSKFFFVLVSILHLYLCF